MRGRPGFVVDGDGGGAGSGEIGQAPVAQRLIESLVDDLAGIGRGRSFGRRQKGSRPRVR